MFSILIIVGRMSRNRNGLAPSYHGKPDALRADYIVHTEFGVDFWKIVFEAKFSKCNLFASEYPAAIAIIARP
jgi:hypothetical protein